MLTAGWSFIPQQAKEKITAFVGIAASRDTGEIKNFIEDVVLPKDPRERREKLLLELEKNISEIKHRAAPVISKAGIRETAKEPEGAVTKNRAAASLQQLVGASEKIIKELQESNDDKSLGQEAGGRILDIILPPRTEIPDCSICQK